MNKTITILLQLILVTTLFIPNLVFSKNLCQKPTKLLFGYFNGMNTTEKEAKKALKTFQDKYGDYTPSPNNDEIVYEIFYNQTQGKVKDVIEIFEQRFIEQNPEFFADRYEFIHEVQEGGGDMLRALQDYEEQVLKPKYGDKYQQKLKELDKQSQEIANDMAIAKMLDEQGNLFKPDYNDNKNYQEYAGHHKQIDSHLQQEHKLLLVAYSQGNLFANAAYDYIKTNLSNAKQLELIHIAPASVTLNGYHVLS